MGQVKWGLYGNLIISIRFLKRKSKSRSCFSYWENWEERLGCRVGFYTCNLWIIYIIYGYRGWDWIDGELDSLKCWCVRD